MSDILAKLGYVVVTDYIEANTGKDVSDELQALIENNPHKTIYFPDGEYVIAKPICTPAAPSRAVALELGNFAIIKASEDWTDSEAMIRLGGIYPENSITQNGSNYYLKGGIIDGSDLASGVSIDGGRETRVEAVSIKNTVIGLHIKRGANSGSSDADILNVNIVGRGTTDSIGVLVEGWDNTFTNMRIASVQIGIKTHTAANMFRNIHPLYIFEKQLEGTFEQSIAFLDLGNNNRYDFCYSDQFATCFEIGENTFSNFYHCFGMWYSPKGDLHTGFKFRGKMRATLDSCWIALREDCTNNNFLIVGEEGGGGAIVNPILVENRSLTHTYRDYLQGKVVY